MKHLNWMVKLLLYKHRDRRVKSDDTRLRDLWCLDVKYQFQTHVNLCTEACENMVGHYHQDKISTLDENPRGIFVGKAHFSDKFVTDNISNFNQLKEMFNKYGPLLISISIRTDQHVITMIGYTKDHVLYHDPLTGPNRIISFTDLKKIHTGENQHIVAAHYPNEAVGAMILTQLTDNPANLVPDNFIKYSRFFTIKNMETPQQAIMESLTSYIDTDLTENAYNNPSCKRSVEAFIESNHDKPLDELLLAINNELKQIADQSDNKLGEGIAAINYFCTAK